MNDNLSLGVDAFNENGNLNKSFGVNNDLEKGGKYFKREGTPGHYKYYYTEKQYTQTKAAQKVFDTLKPGSAHAEALQAKMDRLHAEGQAVGDEQNAAAEAKAAKQASKGKKKPMTYAEAMANEGKEGTKSWSSSKYNKWIKDAASEGGADNAYDMAQNAKQHPGLMEFVKKKMVYNEETPLERIQWDIEAHS